MKKTKHYFIEGLMSLRAAAAQVFSVGISRGASPENISKDIEPLRSAMQHATKRAVESDLGACVIAVQRLESLALAHEEDAKFSLTKAEDNRSHAREIKISIIKNMRTMGVDNYAQEDFTATVSKDADGRETLVLR